MEFKHESNRIFLENEEGKTIAEVTFPETSDNKVNINHTFVDGSLRGQGVADKLLTELAAKLKNNNKKAVPTCSYAVGWFEKHPEYQDLIEN
ncbi:MAG: GNAT family N-acetyltransferase [Sedimentibacter sp.]|uniref:GNAT family N-acetyltransferase n=1 Tax=Sedimentibacter sp. TaxID=1960295 RepID=UPI0031592E2B